MQRIAGADALFLAAETSTMHMHVVGVMVLDVTDVEDWSPDLVTDVLRERIHLIPPFRRRVIEVPAGLDQPRWIEDPDFQLERHIHHQTLESPGDDAALAALTGEIASTPLERDRPLWEMWIVEGLADGSVALVSKVHHAMMDGAAGGDMMASLFDLSPEGEPVEVADEWDPPPAPAGARLAADALTSAAIRTARLPATAVRSAGNWLGVGRSAVSRRLSGEAPPAFAPRTPLTGRLTGARSVALTRCNLDDLRHVRRAFTTTINDVVLAAATTSLRSYLAERDALPDGPLIASVPMSLRTGPDVADADMETRAASLLIPLPVHIADPLQRLGEIRDSSEEAKTTKHSIDPDLVSEWVNLTWVPMIRATASAYSGLGIDALHPPFFNAVISNVMGPPIPLYLGGARVTATYPMGPLIGNAGLNLTVLSHSGDLDVGVIACPDLVDDVEAIATGFVEAVAELAELADAVETGTRAEETET